MGSLTGSLNIALQSLLADQGALDVTSNNIANAATPGYSRQVADLVENPPLTLGANLQFGQGVSLAQIQGIRDQTLENRIQQETQPGGQLDAFLGGMNQVQSLLNEAQGAGLQNPLSQFFNSLQNLSTDPTNQSLRQAVINAGQTLAGAFNSAAAGLSQIQAGLNQSVSQTVTQINQLTQQIAAVNVQVGSLQAPGENPSPFIDQRNQLLEKLANLVDIQVIPTESGMVTVTTASGTALVVGNQSYALTAQTVVPSGNTDVFSGGTDITSRLSSGELGGLIQARDQGLAGVQSSLDTLAYNLASAFNAQHAAGFDLNGSPGGNFFAPLASVTGAAASLAVALSDPSKVAASSDGTPGSNGNALALANLENQNVISGQTVTGFYSNLISTVGNQIADAKTQQAAQSLLLQQLQNQQRNVSGVSLDEEAANLVKYQMAYDASARVVSVVNSLLQTTVSLGG
jgi:flagellar hook-associated protein 1 FlgK